MLHEQSEAKMRHYGVSPETIALRFMSGGTRCSRLPELHEANVRSSPPAAKVARAQGKTSGGRNHGRWADAEEDAEEGVLGTGAHPAEA